jgi:hypothetical protein
MQQMHDCPSLRGLASCQWTKVLQGASIERAELSTMLCDGLAVHAAQQYDLVTLCGLLESQLPSESPVSNMLREVVTFLIAQRDSGGLPPEVIKRIEWSVTELKMTQAKIYVPNKSIATDEQSSFVYRSSLFVAAESHRYTSESPVEF